MKTDSERIVITGIGVVSPIGIGKEEFWRGLTEGRSGIKPVTLFDTSTMKSKLAGEITDFKPEEILGPKGLRNLDRTTLLALSASKLCIDDSKFEINDQNRSDVGVCLGSSMGSVWSISEFDKEGIKNGAKSVDPGRFPNTVMNSPASQIAIRFGIRGFNTTISSGFTSSLEAVAYAKRFLTSGRVKAVLVGGVEELCEQTYKGCYKVGFLSSASSKKEEFCAPFDKKRNGTILGEGAAIFLLETYQDAIRRGAHIYCEIRGVASNCDTLSYNRYNIHHGKSAELLHQVLDRSSAVARDMDCLVSGANSSPLGDAAEYRATKSVFNGCTEALDVSATKSMIGETFSASGAFQVASAIFSIENGVIPPTINYERQDRCCPMNVFSKASKKKKVENILIVNLSPMGQNAALVLSKTKAQKEM